MSADNYFLIRKRDGKFVVSMGFASDEGPPAIAERHPRYDTLEEAIAYAQSEYSEYGYRIDPEILEAVQRRKGV